MPLLTIFGWLTDLVSEHWWTYALVFGVALADAVLPLVPSETIVILAGIAASTGGLHLWIVIVAAWAGVVIGDNLSYLLGSRLGEPAYRRLFKGDEGKKRYDWAHRVLDGQGLWIIPTARFVPGGRTAVTFSAGTVSMRWRRFFLADLSAGLIWRDEFEPARLHRWARVRELELEVVRDGVRDRRRDRPRRHRLLACRRAAELELAQLELSDLDAFDHDVRERSIARAGRDVGDRVDDVLALGDLAEHRVLRSRYGTPRA